MHQNNSKTEKILIMFQPYFMLICSQLKIMAVSWKIKAVLEQWMSYGGDKDASKFRRITVVARLCYGAVVDVLQLWQ